MIAMRGKKKKKKLKMCMELKIFPAKAFSYLAFGGNFRGWESPGRVAAGRTGKISQEYPRGIESLIKKIG